MPQTYDLIVIGGGSAGLVAAGGAAILGAKVALIEKNLLGGDCLYTGCVPSKTLIRSAKFAHQMRQAETFGFQKIEPRFLYDSFGSITDRIQRVIKQIEPHDSPEVFEEMGAEVIFGTPRFLNPNEIEVVLKNSSKKIILKSKRFCISTGSRPFVPPIEGINETGFITNEEVFHLQELPKRLVVLGGGAIGIELGQAFRRFGSRVTIVEAAPRILPKEDRRVSEKLTEILIAEGIDVRVFSTAVAASISSSGEKIVSIQTIGEGAFDIKCDEILCAVGRQPNIEGLDLEKAGVKYDRRSILTDEFLRTSQKNIFAAGDVTAHFQFAHMADYEAQIVIQNAFVPWPFKKKTDFRIVPWATFTDPEAARVGLTEEEAVNKFGQDVKVYEVGFDHNDRAHAEDETAGFAKVVTNRGRIVGAHLLGPHAGELIHEFCWAMRQKMKIGDLGKIIRVYPTLAKITQAVSTEATLESLRSPLVQKWFKRYLRIWK